jgi:hypothetical protein
MNLFDHEVNPKNLPFDLRDCRDKLGIIKSAVLKCPGVYYIRTYQNSDHPVGLEFYIVMDEAPISNEARAYGKRLPSHPELLFYENEAEDFAYQIIRYEILRFYDKHRLPLPEREDSHTAAAFGMETRPDYFGTFPVPRLTPWGYTLRHKALHNGVYWIEAEQCESVLAVNYVLCSDLTEETNAFSKLTEFDLKHGIEETKGYIFFQGDVICLAIFELMIFHPDWNWDMVDRPALMNAIGAKFPKYVTEHNFREQAGYNDFLGLILREFDPSVDLNTSQKNMITMTADVGTDFFRFENQP